IAAFGAFFIPKAYGTSIGFTGGVAAALYGFFIFYVSCVLITWGFYTRRGGLLYEVERRPPAAPMPPALAARPASSREADHEPFSRTSHLFVSAARAFRRGAR